MIKVAVKINGKIYNLVGRENEQYLKEVAEYVDSKINEIKGKNNLLSLVDSAVLAGVNIADELYKVDVEASNISKEREKLVAANQELTKKIEEQRLLVEELSKDKEHSKSENFTKVSVLKEQITTLNEEKNALARDNESYKSTNNNLSKENNKMKEELIQVQNLSDLLNKEIIKIKDENQNLKSELKEEKNKENNIKKNLTEVITNKEIIERQLEERHTNEEVLNQEIDKLKKEKLELQEEFDKAINSKGVLEEEIDLLRNKNSELKKNIAKKLDEKEVSNDLKTSKYKILDLEKKLLDSQIEIAKLKKNQNPLIR